MASLNGITAQYNKKSSAVKRIMQEARELAREPSTDFAASPLESDIFEWHFTIRGPEGTDFEGGLYHGRILLPNNYPFAPPSLMFLTPNGRFELNKKVCLSITGYHPEYWQPAWGIRTVLVAVIGFLPTESKGAIGGLDVSVGARKALAVKSKSWMCKTCNMENVEILPNIEPDKAVKAQLKESEMADFSFGYEADKKAAPTSTAASTEISESTASVAAAADKEKAEMKKQEEPADQTAKPTNSTIVLELPKAPLAGTELPQDTPTAIDSTPRSEGAVVTTPPKDDVVAPSHPPTVAAPAIEPRSQTPVGAAASSSFSSTSTVSPADLRTPSTQSSSSSTSLHPSQTPAASHQQQSRQQQRTAQPVQRQRGNQIPFWFDALIVALGGVLVALIIRKFV